MKCGKSDSPYLDGSKFPLNHDKFNLFCHALNVFVHNE